jgi:hypothetical protein
VVSLDIVAAITLYGGGGLVRELQALISRRWTRIENLIRR